jgi:hypothetical protein
MLIAVICVCVLSGIPSSMSKYVNKREKEQRYCGSKLADKLREVCNGTYESMDKKMKRGMDFFHSRPKQGGAIKSILNIIS